MKKFFSNTINRIYRWHRMDKTKLIEEECKNRWEPLFIETKFESLEECKDGLIHTTNGTLRSGYLKDGIIGDVNKDGSFELTLNLPRTSRCRYVGSIKEVNNKQCIVGNIKPKHDVVVFAKVLMPIYCISILKISYDGYRPESGYSLFYYMLYIFTIFMILPMILDAVLKIDCRKTAELMGKEIYRQVR